MLKARGTINGNDTLILGLSEENIKRLKDDQPIVFAADELGLHINVLIFSGKNEAEMAKLFEPLDRGDRNESESGN